MDPAASAACTLSALCKAVEATNRGSSKEWLVSKGLGPLKLARLPVEIRPAIRPGEGGQVDDCAVDAAVFRVERDGSRKLALEEHRVRVLRPVAAARNIARAARGLSHVVDECGPAGAVLTMANKITIGHVASVKTPIRQCQLERRF